MISGHTNNIHTQTRGRLCYPSEPHVGKDLPSSHWSEVLVLDIDGSHQPHTLTLDFMLPLLSIGHSLVVLYFD